MTEKTPYANHPVLVKLDLGKAVTYRDQYDPSLLDPVPRKLNRDALQLSQTDLPFHGEDIWNGYELSWLQPTGVPAVAILRCWVPFTSPNLIESKSFKLYLNSFNQTIFTDREAVSAVITKDLSNCAGAPVKVAIMTPQMCTDTIVSPDSWQCIDATATQVSSYSLSSSLLQNASHEIVTESLYSDLLKSNCLVTNQPDWATIFIHYTGPKICHAALLQYLISFRQHSEFHEQCVERIFIDLLREVSCEQLTVYARYTRRGGLDINPFRSNFEDTYPDWRLLRQ
jgi:7-cyano-7-deazaguanine reductase